MTRTSLTVDTFESINSRGTTWTSDGGRKTQTREAYVTGKTTPEEAAYLAVVGDPGNGINPAIPSFLPANALTGDAMMVLKSITAKESENLECWTVTGTYESLGRDDNGNSINYTFSGTTSGATQTVTQGIGYQSYGTGPNYAGAINVDKDGVNGVDVVIPKLEFQIEKVIPQRNNAGNATQWFAYLMNILRVTGTVNSAPIFGFAQRELLFLGADFNAKGGGDVTFTFKFVASPNRLVANGNALTIGSISGIEKFGHDYLWVDYRAVESGGFIIREPRTVHVHRVYEDGNFALLNI